MASFSGKPSSKRPTLQTIADELGVTTMTVSKSLRGIGRISEEMRRLVHDKAEEVGYLSSRKRLFPPFLRSSTNSDHRLRLLCPTVGSLQRGDTVPYRTDMIDGLRQSVDDMDGEVLVESFRTLREMQTLLGKERFHGVVLSEPYPSHWISSLRELAPIIYTIGHDFQEGVDSVYFNEARASALAADQLREAGHRHIAWLGIEDRHAPFLVPDEEFLDERTADWLSHSNHGTRFASWLYLANQHPDLAKWPVSLIERDWRTSSLEDAVRRGCREIFESRPQPTAIVCVSNAVARELILQLEANGLSVPNDLSVISYGVEETGRTDDGLQLSGLLMPMDKVGGLVPEIVQRRLAYPDGLALSIQLDAEWQPGETFTSPRT
jgi:DNA-binding LacI/PurR family transcriptional regulator